MANKFTYFPFYGEDFYSDPLVQGMNLEQEAIYMRLLWAAWKQNEGGTLPCDDQLLCKIARIKRTTWAKNKDAVLKPFAFGDDGRWHQKRMKQEYAAALQRSNAAALKARKRWIKHGSNGENDAEAMLAQHKPSNATRLSLSSLNSVVSVPRSPDPNTYVPPPIRTQPGTPIDRKEPPFPNTDFWKYQDLKSAMRSYLAHVYDKFNWSLSHREFATLIYDLESEFKSSKAVEAALRRTIRKGIKGVLFPSETGEILKR